MKLLIAATQDGASGVSPPVEIKSTLNRSLNDLFTIHCWGTFGTATAKVRVSSDGVKYIDVPSASFTSEGLINMQVRSQFVDAVVTGGDGTTSINMTVL